MSYLEQVAIPHRDIKPENLGIIQAGPRKQRRLVLMDFSLSGAAADQLQVGTRPYLDPFLGAKFKRSRWDLAGDRFAAAMVLHEMAAGILPYWGSRTTDPRFTDAEVTVDRDAFPREVAEPLAELLQQALAREIADRFDTADDMERAWARIFQQLDQTAVDPEAKANAADLRSRATHTTPVVALGLSARAANLLERQNALTVADLLALPPLAINTARGVGLDTRRELVDAQRDLRERLGTAHPTVAASAGDVEAPGSGRLDALVAELVPARTVRNANEVETLTRLLGLEPLADEREWPSQTEVAGSLDLTRARVGQILARARTRWRKIATIDQLRDELLDYLAALGSIGTPAELERALVVDRSTGDPGQDRMTARAVVRAAIEVELAEADPRLAQRRTRDGQILLTSAGDDVVDRQRALDHVIRLGAIADELALGKTLAAPAEVAARLTTPAAPSGLNALSRDRLVILAAAASTKAAVSARLELYARDLPAQRALALGRGALLGNDAISASEIQRRIAARFPQAQPLPDRPQLDRLLEDGGFDLRWDKDLGVYVAPQRIALTGLTSYESSIGRLATANASTIARPTTDPDVVAAYEFERRLMRPSATGACSA